MESCVAGLCEEVTSVLEQDERNAAEIATARMEGIFMVEVSFSWTGTIKMSLV
jgi:hypothetical protein